MAARDGRQRAAHLRLHALHLARRRRVGHANELSVVARSHHSAGQLLQERMGWEEGAVRVRRRDEQSAG